MAAFLIAAETGLKRPYPLCAWTRHIARASPARYTAGVITALTAYLALFLAAFLAATIVPAQSEAVLVGLILAGEQSLWMLLLVATTGNVLGSVVNWWLGRFIEHFRNRPWFPVSPERLARAQTWYRRFGTWSLLLSWVPIIGDPLTVVAGVLRTRFLTFFLLVTLAKAGRYAVLAAATLQVAG